MRVDAQFEADGACRQAACNAKPARVGVGLAGSKSTILHKCCVIARGLIPWRINGLLAIHPELYHVQERLYVALWLQTSV